MVARREFKLADFKLMKNQRPLQSLRQVLSGEADCALLDDAQLAELKHLAGLRGREDRVAERAPAADGGGRIPRAPPAEKKKFRELLTVVCEGDGNTVCAEVGIDTLAPAGASDYAEVVSAYGR